MYKNIVLTGMPGCGKSTIGSMLSKYLGMDFIDMDNYIEKHEQKSIKEMFSISEEFFRDAESKCAKELGKLNSHIIATGGGIIKRKENIEHLKDNSIIIFINRPVENIIMDIDTDTRPLLAEGKEKMYNLYNERIELYKKYCDIEINNNGNILEAIDAIMKIIGGNQMKITVINGPNINFLGIREKNIYGMGDYESLCQFIKDEAKKLNVEVEIFQSNSEGEIINSIQSAYGSSDGIIINPGAYTHYSIAIYDALKSVDIKAVEVHISNIYKREEFRHKSVTAPACIGQISGFGFHGYKYAMEALLQK